jgi:hypothetical protein
MQAAPLSPSQKTEILRRQAFKCDSCQADLEPAGRAPPHFERASPEAAKGASATSNLRALCPACHSMGKGPRPESASDQRRRRQRESETGRGATKFVKSGVDTRKF